MKLTKSPLTSQIPDTPSTPDATPQMVSLTGTMTEFAQLGLIEETHSDTQDWVMQVLRNGQLPNDETLESKWGGFSRAPKSIHAELVILSNQMPQIEGLAPIYIAPIIAKINHLREFITDEFASFPAGNVVSSTIRGRETHRGPAEDIADPWGQGWGLQAELKRLREKNWTPTKTYQSALALHQQLVTIENRFQLLHALTSSNDFTQYAAAEDFVAQQLELRRDVVNILNGKLAYTHLTGSELTYPWENMGITSEMIEKFENYCRGADVPEITIKLTDLHDERWLVETPAEGGELSKE